MSLLLAYQVKDKHCLVIGGGDVALSRVHHLIKAQAKITVVSKSCHPDILDLHKQGKIFKLVERDYKLSDLTMYEPEGHRKPVDINSITKEDYKSINNAVFNYTFANVCCCIDEYDVSELVYYQCKALGLPVNIADKPPLCDFYFGSMFNQENLQIMISTNGRSPRLLKLIKDNIAKQFQGVDVNKAVENLGTVRATLRSNVVIDDDLVSIDTRMNWIKELTDFFSLHQWSSIEIGKTEAEKIVSYFPKFPPKDYDEFKKVIETTN